MRISTNAFYDQSISNFNTIQSKQLQLQNQISTGKRILTPSDDPIASAQILQIKNAQNINAEYTNTRKTVQNNLSAADGILGNVTNLLASIKSSITAANKSTLSDSDRASIAAELQNNLSALIAYGNSQDSNGDYMFAGHSVKTQPFPSATTAYAGDSNQRLAQVSSSRQMSMSDSGDNLFPATTSGTAPDIFTTLTNVISALNSKPATNGTIPTLNATLAASGATIDATMNAVLNSRASIGARLNELDGLDAAGSALDTQYASTLSDLEDLDYAKALSEVSKQSTILEAAQKAFTKVSSMSLFSVM